MRFFVMFFSPKIYFAGLTTQLTPQAVSAIPSNVKAVMGSSNNNHATKAVQGGTRYIKLVTLAAAPF
jgi:hypothetical protein